MTRAERLDALSQTLTDFSEMVGRASAALKAKHFGDFQRAINTAYLFFDDVCALMGMEQSSVADDQKAGS